MNDISTLQIRVLSDQVSTATNRLNALEKQAYGTERATSGLSNTFGKLKSLAGATAAFLTASAAARGFMDVISRVRNYQVLQAQLKTATGSVQGATLAFNQLRKIAAETPFTLNEVSTSFVKLINYGLTPSERALKAYGNVAAGMTKDVGMFIEAIADASVGEFTRIKESFGITGKNLGDKVAFTFRGITTEVANNTKAIEDYFISLGEGAFGGAMEERMKTLDGAISNLGDAWDTALVNLGNSTGVAGGAETAIRSLTEAITELDQSGDLADYFNRGTAALTIFGNIATAGFNLVQAAVSGLAAGLLGFASDFITFWGTTAPTILNGWAVKAEGALSQVQQGFANFGTAVANSVVTAMNIAIIAVEKLINAAVDGLNKVIQSANSFAGTSISTIDRVNWSGNMKGNYQQFPVADELQLNADGSVNWDSASGGVNLPEIPTGGAGAAGYLGDLSGDYAGYASGRLDSVGEDVRDAALAWDTMTGPGVLPPPPDNATTDLSQFGTGNGGSNTPSKSKKSGGGGSGGSADKDKQEFDRLVKQLQSENTAVEAAYQERLAIIEKYTADGSKAEMDLSLALVAEWEKDTQAAIDQRKRSTDTMWEAFQEEETLLQESYDRRREIILQATQITEEQRAALLEKIETEHQKKVAQHNAEINKQYLDAASQFFGNLSAMGSAFGKRGFKIAQAAAIAETTINTYASATAAYKSLANIPYVGPALGVAAAAAAVVAGMANVAQIRSQTYQEPGGASFAAGGIVPGSAFTGDQVPARLNSGEAVLTRSQQSRLFDLADGRSGSSSSPTINIYNSAPGVDVSAKTSKKGDKEQYDIFVKQMAGNMRRGGDPFSQTLEDLYPALRRGR